MRKCEPPSGEHEPNDVAQASERAAADPGRTVDDRVAAIVPVVIDCLNIETSFVHHYRAYGFWAPAIAAYQASGIMRWAGTSELASLLAIEDPFAYRDRLTMPKFIINSAGDQYFLPDSSQFYFDCLAGEKYLRYVPNTDHSLHGSDAGESAFAFYEAIVAGVTEITAGAGTGTQGRAAFGRLAVRLEAVIESAGGDSLLPAAAAGSGLTHEQVIANAAVLLFGGIETTEGMIAGVLLHLLERPEVLAHVRAQPRLLNAAIEESLRLEPAAAVIDRYATRQARLGGAEIAAGDLVRISITAANRDPAVFVDPNRFDLTRDDGRPHLAFAQGPHVCVGVHLARLETCIGIAMLLQRLPDLRLDPARPSRTRGLVFRKPPELHALWE